MCTDYSRSGWGWGVGEGRVGGGGSSGATIRPNEHYTLYTFVKVSKSSKRPTKNYLEILIFVHIVT